jgi:hypothetical protein
MWRKRLDSHMRSNRRTTRQSNQRLICNMGRRALTLAKEMDGRACDAAPLARRTARSLEAFEIRVMQTFLTDDARAGLSRASNDVTDGLCLRDNAFHETYVAGRFKFIVRIPRQHYVSGPAAQFVASKKSETQIGRALMVAIFMAMS